MIRRDQGDTPPASTTSGTLVASTGSSATSYADSGLSPDTEYSYALFAAYGSGYSAAATITVTTGQPPAMDVTGTLTSDTTWSPAGASAYIIQGDLDVPAGITLTIEPGTVIKGSGSGAKITVEGSLVAVGSSSSPITFTSVNDNSVGGSTGSGSPAAGDWGGIEVSGAGSVDAEHAGVEYAYSGVWGSTTGAVKLVDDSFSSLSHGGVDVGAGDVTAEDNSVTGGGSFPAYWVDSPSLDLGQVGGNSASGGIPGFYLAGTVSTSSTWQAEQAAWLIGTGCDGANGTIDVPAGVTVTIAAGTVIKGSLTTYAGCGSGSSNPAVTVEGSLVAVGSSSSPITFTSVNDNSVGGSTGLGSPAAGDWGGIEVSGAGSVDAEHAGVEYAYSGVWGSTTGAVKLVDDSFSSLSHGGVDVGAGDVTAEDNSVTGGGSFPAYWVDSPSLDLGQVGGNSASGGIPGFYLAGTVSTSSTWQAEQAAWLIGTGCDGANGTIDVPAGVTVTIAAGTVIKGSLTTYAGCGSGSSNPAVTVEGSLVAVGSSSSPITFTSVNDNSVGGSTGLGSPAAGDWGGIEVSGAGSVDAEHAGVEYAYSGVWGSTTGAVKLVDDSFSSLSHGGVDVGAGDVTAEDNSVTGGGSFPAYWVDSPSLDLGQVGGNSASGGIPGFYLAGTVSTSSTWQAEQAAWLIGTGCDGANGTIDVPAGVTVTIAAGTVIKGSLTTYAGCGSGSSNPAVTVEGSLVAVGSSSSPITFTSVNDNSVGGSTGSGSPAAGDWGGIEVSGAGSVDAEHAGVEYAYSGVWGSTTGAVKLVDDSFSSLSHGGVDVGAGDVTAEDNSVTGGGSFPAYWVDSPSLDLGQVGGNSASGGIPGFYLAGTVSTSSTWQAEQAAWLIGTGCDGANGTIDVPAGVTVTIAAGTVIKGSLTTYAGCGSGSSNPAVTVEGSLVAVGSSSSPITFTSVNDNSVGGSTGLGSPAAGDWGGIEVSGAGSVDAEHAGVEYAYSGVWGSTTGAVKLVDDSFSSLSHGGVDVGAGDVTAEDNSVTGGGSFPAYWVDSPSLDLGQVGGNSASGGIPGFYLAGTVSTSSTWQAEQAAWLIGTGCDGANGTIDVPAGVTVTIAAGTVIKGSLTTYAGCGSGSSNPAVTVEGSLVAVGSSSSPITFTSVNDNSVGGSTGLGSPAAGDWGGIEVSGAGGGTTAGDADIENTVLNYAATGIAAAGAAAVTFRGTLANNTMDITSCDWGTTGCTVDAAYTNWDDGSTGPFPASGALVCGAVTVSPWLPVGSTGVFSDGNCDGSATPDTTLNSAETTYNQGIASEQIQCDDGLQDACQAIQTAEACLSAAYGLAQESSSFELPALSGDYTDAGSNWLQNAESVVVTGISPILDFASSILGVVTTILDIANAYNECDP